MDGGSINDKEKREIGSRVMMQKFFFRSEDSD